MSKVWDVLVRWRTWIVNAFFSLLLFLPAILNSPELLAVIPVEYQRWVLLAAFVINVWMRPRPADRAADLDPGATRSRKK